MAGLENSLVLDCQKACRKYHVCRAPEENALVIALITTMPLHQLVPATLTTKDCFSTEGDNHLLSLSLTCR